MKYFENSLSALFVIYCQTKGFSAARCTVAFGIPFFVLVFMLAFTDKRILRRKLIKNWQYITTILLVSYALLLKCGLQSRQWPPFTSLTVLIVTSCVSCAAEGESRRESVKKQLWQ